MHRHFDVAMKAAREGTLPYPDGTIIAGLAWELRPVGGKREGLWPSPIPSWPGHLRTGFFMVKDSTKYAGWGFAHFGVANPPARPYTHLLRLPRNG